MLFFLSLFAVLISGPMQIYALFRLVGVLEKHCQSELQGMQNKAAVYKGKYYAALNIMFWSRGIIKNENEEVRSALYFARLTSLAYMVFFTLFALTVMKII